MSYIIGFIFGGIASFFVYCMFNDIGNENAIQLYNLFSGFPVWSILLIIFVIGLAVNFAMQFGMDSVDKKMGVKKDVA